MNGEMIGINECITSLLRISSYLYIYLSVYVYECVITYINVSAKSSPELGSIISVLQIFDLSSARYKI